MADIMLASRTPLAHLAEPSRLGDLAEAPGVTLREERDLTLTLLVANRNQVGDMRRAAQGAGLSLPSSATAVDFGDGCVLWCGPEQWLVATGRAGTAHAEAVVRACGGLCMVVDQSDARAVVSISGPKARAVLMKGVGIDLHPSVFDVGSTALSPVAGVHAQIWQSDATPTFMLAVPRSFAESTWAWLREAAAEYGYAVVA